MSYANPFGKTLKADEARFHWENHVLCNEGLHRTGREKRAAKAGRTYEEELDQEFAFWYVQKQMAGFANFDAAPFHGDD